MLETQIKMEPEAARGAYLAYRNLKENQRTAEDEEIRRSYLELSRGRGVLNATDALEAAGLGPDGRPRIAFCRADARWCWGMFCEDMVRFSTEQQQWSIGTHRPECKGSKMMECRVPGLAHQRQAKTVVPIIPPAHRPAASLHRFWLMWEVAEDGWEEVPIDPALLKRLNATTFAVLAVWDLTEVERMVLRSRQGGE